MRGGGAAKDTDAPVKDEEVNVETKDKPNGKQVADDLVGYTNNKEKTRVINNINNLASDNVVDFLNDYNKNKGLGDNIMKQINTELGWTNDEKVKAQKNILKFLLDKANDQGVAIPEGTKKYCDEFLGRANSSPVSHINAQNLDGIINNILEQIQAKTTIS